MKNNTGFKLTLSAVILFVFLIGCGVKGSKQTQNTDAIIASLIAKMTTEQKINMLHGNTFFTSGGVEELGIPELHYSDGPFGVREELHADSWTPLGLTTDSATYLPTGSALGATWNSKLAFQYGKVLGQEARARGKDVILGPAIDIDRNPNNGRTFEYLTEDPVLNAQLAVAYVKGVQKQGVAACAKHFAANNQETDRDSINTIVGERAMHEIYFPAFKAVVQKGNVDAIMAAYNKVNGHFCAANHHLLTEVLRNDWGFDGIIVSDWGGVHSTIPTAKAGLDVEMDGDSDYDNYYFAKPLVEAVKAGKVSEDLIDKKVSRILSLMFKLNMLGDGNRKEGALNTPKHRQIAYEVATESIVLLKNKENRLPLDVSKLKSIAVIGGNATIKQAQLGFGAGVKSREITPLAGLKEKLKGKVKVHYVPGYKEVYEDVEKNKGRHVPIKKTNPTLVAQAVEAAKKADAVIFIGGNTRTYETEGTDRLSLALPFGQDELIKAVTAANPNTVVVIISGSPVELNQVVKETDALVWSGFNGSQGGRALADVLFGDVNPSGKLPFTFPKSLNDVPSQVNGSFPGKDGVTRYKEGILVGYRWYDTKNIEPLFPFGYGLSYTHFEFSNIHTNKDTFSEEDTIQVSVTLKNIGDRAGKETVQLYVHAVDPDVMMADKTLKAFSKVALDPGQEKTIVLPVAVKDLAYYDADKNKWVVLLGKYQLKVGSFSRNIQRTVAVQVQ